MLKNNLEAKYALIAVKALGPLEEMETLEVLHTCFYEEKPTESDEAALKEELAITEEFGMVGLEENRDYYLVSMEGEELDPIKEVMGLIEFDNEEEDEDGEFFGYIEETEEE